MSAGSGYVITTIVTAPDTTNLTTLANVKLSLGLDDGDTAQDAWITAAIPRASASITRYLNRTLANGGYQDRISPPRGIIGEGSPHGLRCIQLKVWPVSEITSIVETRGATSVTLVATVDFEVDLDLGLLYRLNSIGMPRRWDAPLITVQYTAGYVLPADENPTLPPDIEDACIRMITRSYQSRGRDPSLKREASQGREREYWIPDTPTGNMTPDIAEILDPYRALPV